MSSSPLQFLDGGSWSAPIDMFRAGTAGAGRARLALVARVEAARGPRLFSPGGQFCSDLSIKGGVALQPATPGRPKTEEPKMDKRAEIDRFVRQHNIEHYRKLLGEPTDLLRRQQLQMLLAELDTAAVVTGALERG